MLHTPTQMEVVIEVSSNEGITWTAAPEYKTITQDKTCSSYIEAVTGQLFRILLRSVAPVPPLHEIGVYFVVDGYTAANRLLKRSKLRSTVEGFELSNTAVRPFAFSEIATANVDDNVGGSSAKVRDLGRIELRLWNVRIGVPSGSNPVRQAPASTIFDEQQVKKHSSHNIELKQVRETRAREVLKSEKLEKAPFLTFTFRYMSDVFLDLNKIKPLEQMKEILPPARPALMKQPAEPNSTITSTPTVKIEEPSIKVKIEETSARLEKRSASSVVIIADDDEDEIMSELRRLREENARLRKRVKTEDT